MPFYHVTVKHPNGTTRTAQFWATTDRTAAMKARGVDRLWAEQVVLKTVRPAPMVDITLLRAGSYKVLSLSPDGREWHIVKSDWEGPEGGTRWLWEPIYFEAGGGGIVGATLPGHTLREARQVLAEHFTKLGSAENLGDDEGKDCG